METDSKVEALGDDARHAEKMRKKQSAQAKVMASKTRKQGLLIVHTGKGKTSAALGMMVRAIGHG
ncbi:cob(I)yrinic acid a,c-diamide adenosyltransferase [Sphingobium sp. CR2-8]|uniref:cob(I)yrinic acid a,c-diamide adenosyltransferase n=1 Tax=Sphingobium sp. CR2-8 TaxID=1306534 RepID=UPI002DB6E1B8|nr:cob(I)yrinic acid a,c-diamide adenosyltransferase [Sphingobium sp. CR2-8]MEC3909082.1 cob(I)yrinic acid a,c-diamide adenosyltransferase [Sphingobium sp. CR2-8]